MLWRRSERGLLLLQRMWVCHMLVRMAMVVVMVMVMVDGELWQRSRVYVLVWEVMLHHGEPDGVVEEVMVMDDWWWWWAPKGRNGGGTRTGGGGFGNAPGAAYPGQPATGPIGGRPRCASSSCPRSSCRRRSSQFSKFTPNGTMPAAHCA